MNTINEKHSLHWFAVQTTYCREFKLKKQFEAKKIQSFVPTRYESTIKDEVKRYEEVPAVHNLVFVRSTCETLDEQIQERNNGTSFQYMIDAGTKSPVVIPDKEMDDFIQVTKVAGESLLYLRDDIERFRKYSHIRVTGGRFEGIEGYFVRIRRDRKVVILLQNVAAVAISGIDHSLIEVIK